LKNSNKESKFFSCSCLWFLLLQLVSTTKQFVMSKNTSGIDARAALSLPIFLGLENSTDPYYLYLAEC
jgi:hypothetical protein